MAVKQEYVWTINPIFLAAVAGTVLAIWLVPFGGGIPAVMLLIEVTLFIGHKLDRAKKRRD